MSQKLRIAVVGAGVMGRDHVRYIKGEDNAVLCGVADPAPEAEAVAAASGVPYFADHRQMLDSVKPDGVIIASPNKLHIPMAYDALERNIPMLVEKPISDDVAEALKFAQVAEKKSVPVLVGQHRRHNPAVQKTKEIIASGKLGKMVTINCSFTIYKPDDYYNIEWRRKKGAGPILVNMVHDVDLLRYLVGEIEEVQAMTANNARGFEVEDSAVVNARFANGALASITLSDSVVSPWNWEATARENPFFAPVSDDCWYFGGTRGGITMPQVKLYQYPGDQGWDRPLECVAQAVKPALPHVMQFKHFCKVIKGEAKPLVTPRDGATNVAVLNAIKKAAEKGSKELIADYLRVS